MFSDKIYLNQLGEKVSKATKGNEYIRVDINLIAAPRMYGDCKSSFLCHNRENLNKLKPTLLDFMKTEVVLMKTSYLTYSEFVFFFL